jgi:transposase
MSYFIGLDLSLKETAVSVVDRQGNKIWYGKTLSDPESIIHSLRAWQKEIELIGLEACPLSEWIYAGLRDQGLNVCCIETRHAQRFLSSRPNKTDRNDADGIAQMMRLGHFKPVHVKSRTAQGIQTIIAARAQIVNTMVKLELTARGLIKKFGHKISRGGRVSFAERVRMAISADADLYMAINPLLDSRETLRQQKLSYDKVLYAMSRKSSVCRALMTVPGVGPVTSLAFVAIIDDPYRFANSRAVGAHLGLTPKTYQSGEIDHNGHISKCGDKMMRYLLFKAAGVLLARAKQSNPLKAWGIKIAKKCGNKKARTAVARKLSIIMHRIWKEHIKNPGSPTARFILT